MNYFVSFAPALIRRRGSRRITKDGCPNRVRPVT